MSERLTDERLAGRKLYLESIAIVPFARDVSGEISIITELLALRARNAKLEAALGKCRPLVGCFPQDSASSLVEEIESLIGKHDWFAPHAALTPR